jgi:superfamily II DNA or RNA helicase
MSTAMARVAAEGPPGGRTHGLLAQNGFHPRYYQVDAIEAVLKELADGIRRTIVVLPTGTGKTVLFPMLVHRLGTPTLVLAHRSELLDQAQRTLAKNGHALVGIEQGARNLRGDEEIILASIPTLTMSPKRLDRLLEIPFRAILVDEVHHCAAPSWKKVLQRFKVFEPGGPPVVGFTATPKRGDRVGLQTIFQSIAYSRNLGEMIFEGWCAPVRAYSVATQTSLDAVKFYGEDGDFNVSELGKCVNTPARNALAVEAYRRYNTNHRPTLVFATTVEHAKTLDRLFKAGGVRSSYVADNLTTQERNSRIAQFKSGKLDVLVNITILTEGFDHPPLSCILFARPTSSPLLYAQIIGRGTRLAQDKDDCLVIDMVDACSRHQLQNIATLFGLDPQVVFNGEDVRRTAQQIEDELARHPSLTIDGRISAEELLRRAANAAIEVTPIEIVPLSLEVQKFSRLAWYKISETKYLIDAADANYLHCIQNLLGHWEIFRMPVGVKIAQHPTLAEAFKAAEDYLKTHNERQYHLKRQDAKWRNNPASTGQEAYLRRINRWQPGLSCGQASQIIEERKIYQLEHPPEAMPATAKQEALLKKLGRWETGMSKKAASDAIDAWAKEPADEWQLRRLRPHNLARPGMTRTEAKTALDKLKTLMGDAA